MRGLELTLDSRVREGLDRHLQTSAKGPIAVALSGGGDSLALALIAADWASTHGRRLLILTVDHQINAASPGWTLSCREIAARLGADFRALSWEGLKPATGLPAAARVARHRLLATAARQAGAQVILMGHTASDRLEASAMRQSGSSTPSPRVWGPSPVWPEGRGIFLLRPMLATRRAEIRTWLAARGESWIEDPSNEDPRLARARARAGLTGCENDAALPAPDLTALARATQDLAGGLTLPRQVMAEAPAAFISAACLCAAGTTRPPRGERLNRLVALLRGREPFTATLAGARIEADATNVCFLREAGEVRRGGLTPLALAAGEAAIWDGRWELTTDRALEVRALVGSASSLSSAARATLSALPPGARGSLPLILGHGSPVLTPLPGVGLRPLALERLQAACGVIETEAA